MKYPVKVSRLFYNIISNLLKNTVFRSVHCQFLTDVTAYIIYCWRAIPEENVCEINIVIKKILTS